MPLAGQPVAGVSPCSWPSPATRSPVTSPSQVIGRAQDDTGRLPDAGECGGEDTQGLLQEHSSGLTAQHECATMGLASLASGLTTERPLVKYSSGHRAPCTSYSVPFRERSPEVRNAATASGAMPKASPICRSRPSRGSISTAERYSLSAPSVRPAASRASPNST